MSQRGHGPEWIALYRGRVVPRCTPLNWSTTPSVADLIKTYAALGWSYRFDRSYLYRAIRSQWDAKEDHTSHDAYIAKSRAVESNMVCG